MGAGIGCLATLLAALLLAGWLGLTSRPAAAKFAATPGVLTYFYYWYEPEGDDPSGVESYAGQSLHFLPDRPGDWRSVDWFKDQLTDMGLARIDVALTVYWGSELYPETGWSTAGLERLARALDELAEEGTRHPHVALFLDTYILEGADLTDPERRAWLAEEIRTFFRHIPSRHWATEDDRPIVWLYVSDFANGFDQGTFEQLGEDLESDLGARPFWVAEQSWQHATWTDGEGERHFDPDQPIGFDAFYRWGAAVAGTLFVDQPLPIAAVGPGYDDTFVVGRGDDRMSRAREDGCFYARSWRKAQALGAHWVVIETWDEFYEGSGIAESAEWGRTYIDATRTYSAAFKGGEPIALPSDCPDIADDDEAPAVEEAPQVVPVPEEPSQPAPVPCPKRSKRRSSRGCP